MPQETRWRGTLVGMLAGGAVGLFLAPVVAPTLARALRPMTKAAIKAGRAVYQRGLETAAEFKETIEDVTAELAAEAAAAASEPEQVVPPPAPAEREGATPEHEPSFVETPRAARRARAAVH